MAVKTLDATNGVHQGVLPPQITGGHAMRKAKNYLARNVSVCFGASEPELLVLDKVVWQVLIHFKPPIERRLRSGFLNVDAITGEVFPLTEDEINAIHRQASALIRAIPRS